MKMDMAFLLKQFLRVEFVYFMLSLILTFALIPLRAYRWNNIKIRLGLAHSYRESLYSSVLAYSLSSLTPGRIGEISKLVFLKRRTSTKTLLISIYLDRMFDIFVIVWAVFSLLFLISIDFPSGEWKVTFQAATAVLWPLTGLALYAPFSTSLVAGFKEIYFLMPAQLQKALREFPDDKSTSESVKKSNLYLWGILFTIFVLFVQTIRVYILSKGMSLPVPFSMYAWLVPMMLLVNLLPISVSGLGTREAVFVFFLSPNGIAQETALCLSLLVFSQGFILALVSSLLLALQGNSGCTPELGSFIPPSRD